jgi:hypothetical protein
MNMVIGMAHSSSNPDRLEQTAIIDWLKIVGGALLSVALAAATFASAVENTLARYAHPMVIRLAPNSPAMLTALANRASGQLLVAKKRPGLALQTDRQATRALRKQPFNPVALRSLGIAKIAEGDKHRGEQLILLAGQMTHRDLLTQAWLFDHFLLTGRVEEAFAAMDLALRVKEEIRPLFFPRLAQALGKLPDVQRALRPYMTKDNPWAASFVSDALNLPGGGELISGFAKQIGGLPHNRLFQALQPEVVRHLLEDGKYADAQAYLRFYDPQADEVLNRLDFNPANIDPQRSAFSWRLSDMGGVYTEFVKVRNGTRELLVDAGQQDDGTLLTKTLVLSPGAYSLRTLPAEGAPDHPWAFWRIICKSTGAQLARAEPGRTISFAIPAGCSAQEITFQMQREAGAVAPVFTAHTQAPQLSFL